MINKIEKLVAYKQKVYTQLKCAIINQHFKPGDMLNERNLAQELGVSRTPVREALQLLESEGFVKIVPWKGVFVTKITMRQMKEVFQIRLILECLVAELALGKVTPEQLKELHSLLLKQQRFAEKQQADEFIRFDRIFHATLCEIADNRELKRLLASLENVIIRLSVQAVQEKMRYQATLAEHAAILDALAAKDYDLAITAVKKHIKNTEESLSYQLAQLTAQDEEDCSDEDCSFTN